MRWNETEVCDLAQKVPEWEGKLFYRPPAKTKSKGIVGTISGALAGSGIGPMGSEKGSLFYDGAGLNDASGGKNEQSVQRQGTGELRWFRIKANMLFYFKLTTDGRKPALPGPTEPLGVLVLENCHVQREGAGLFSDVVESVEIALIFAEEPDKKHLFRAETPQRALQWETALRMASYSGLRERLMDLQIKLRTRHGVESLRGSPLETLPLFRPPQPNNDHLVNENFADLIGSSHSLSTGSKVSGVAKKASFKSHLADPKGSFKSHILCEESGLPRSKTASDIIAVDKLVDI